MPNPKRRHSAARRGNRRAHDSLKQAALVRVPELPRAEAAAPGVPALRAVQRPRSHRSRAGVECAVLRRHASSHADHCSRRHGRGSCPEAGSRRRDSGRQKPGGQGHPGGPRRRGAARTGQPRRLALAADRNPSRQRTDHHGRQRRQGRAQPSVTVRCAWPRAWCATARPGIRLRRQHRRGHGHRQNGAGRGARRGPSGAGRRVSHARPARPW